MKLIDYLYDIIYPPRCIVCGDIAKRNENEKAFCDKCRKNIPWLKGSLGSNKYYKKAIAAFDYSIVGPTVKAYKFGNQKYLSKSIGYAMYTYISENYAEILHKCDIICHLPIHSTRLIERGFDQSELIAKYLSYATGIPHGDAIVRVRATERQSLMDDQSARIDNVKDAFKTIKPVKDKTVLLIDDVVTTGNTANECAKSLILSGAKEVYVFTFSASTK